MTTLIASAFPNLVEAAGGQVVTVQLSIANTSDRIDAYAVTVFGLDPLWITLEPERLSLFPGDIGLVDVQLRIPAGYPAGMRSLTFHVLSENDQTQFALATISLGITGRPKMAITLDPTSITGGSQGQFGMILANQGNARLSIRPSALDPEEQAAFDFSQQTIDLLPGEQAAVQATVAAKRPWIGTPKVRVLTFTGQAVDTDESVIGKVETMGTFIQRPRIGRWLMSLLGLVTAAAVFAAVLSHTLNSVVDKASVSDDLVNEALANGQVASPMVPLKPARLTGKVISATSAEGAGIAGVQAELYSAGDGTVPLASAATAADGTFAFGGIGGGTYRVRFTGAGFGQLWYPGGRVFSEGADIVVPAEGSKDLDPVPFGGLRASVSGKVTSVNGQSITGAKVSLFSAGVGEPPVPALVATVDVSADGSFTLTAVPSPAQYTLIAERPGAATETRQVAVAAGQQLEGIEITLRPGDGLITGTVFADGQPAGGVTISVTDGTNTVATVSLSEAPIGSYNVRNLAVPGVYTVTVSRTGLVTQTRAVTLSSATPFQADFSLVPSIGSISGTVTSAGNVSLGGVSVRLTGGDAVITATSVSQGTGAGTYLFDQLPVPGVYTLTFSADGYITRVRQTTLDPTTGETNREGIDVTLASSLSQVSGTITNVGGVPVGRAEVTLDDGANQRVLLSADDPAGTFAFGNVAPGNYTLKAHLVGAADVVRLVTVTAGNDVVADLQLGRQASLSGVVVTAGGVPVPNAVVRLFLPANFPNGANVQPFVLTNSAGQYTFLDVSAPTDFVVAVFPDQNATVPLDSETTVSEPGTDVAVGSLVAS